MDLKKSVGKLGVWVFFDGLSAGETAKTVQTLESMGVAALWVPEAAGRDPFAFLGFLAGQTNSIYLATGIANIYARGTMAMKAASHTVQEASKGRFILGLGVSHREGVGPVWHQDYGKPVPTMRAFLESMHAGPYRGPKHPVDVPIVLATLRSKMLTLAKEVADGAHPYFTPPEHTARAREIIGHDKWLAPEQAVVFEKDPTTARRTAREYMSVYLRLENYRNNLKTLGFREDDLEKDGSDRLVDAIVAWGDEKTIYQRIEDHWHAGADHVCVQTLSSSGAPGVDLDFFRAISQLHHE